METAEIAKKREEIDKNIIRFRKPFSEKYNLTVTTDLLAGNFPVQTKTLIRWALRVISINDQKQTEIELITIENKLVETNNPNLNDIAAFSQAFSRMYSEIHVVLDEKGKVAEIINLSVILAKWEQTKTEMQKLLNEIPAMQEVINLNDEIFASPDKIKLAIESNEFFNICFHLIYGVAMPAGDLRETHRNMFNTTDVNWQYSAESVQGRVENDLVTDVSVIGKPLENLNKEWAKQAYQAFPVIDASQLDAQLSEKGNYRFESETGKLLEAVWIKEEIAHPEYIHGKMTYKLKADVGLSNGDGVNKATGKVDYQRQPIWTDGRWVD